MGGAERTRDGGGRACAASHRRKVDGDRVGGRLISKGASESSGLQRMVKWQRGRMPRGGSNVNLMEMERGGAPCPSGVRVDTASPSQTWVGRMSMARRLTSVTHGRPLPCCTASFKGGGGMMHRGVVRRRAYAPPSFGASSTTSLAVAFGAPPTSLQETAAISPTADTCTHTHRVEGHTKDQGTRRAKLVEPS